MPADLSLSAFGMGKTTACWQTTAGCFCDEVELLSKMFYVFDLAYPYELKPVYFLGALAVSQYRSQSDVVQHCFIPRLDALRQEEKNLHPRADLALSNDDWMAYWTDGYCSHLIIPPQIWTLPGP